MQIKHSYSAKPNEDFLQYYGFVDSDNVNDVYTADVLQWVTQHFQMAEEQLQAVEADAAALWSLQQVALVVAGAYKDGHICCREHSTQIKSIQQAISCHSPKHIGRQAFHLALLACTQSPH